MEKYPVTNGELRPYKHQCLGLGISNHEVSTFVQKSLEKENAIRTVCAQVLQEQITKIEIKRNHFLQLFKESVLTMPYIANPQDDPRHELEFENRLKCMGFKSAREIILTKKGKKNTGKNGVWPLSHSPCSHEILNDMEPMTYVIQPFSSQRTVDILICPQKYVVWPWELKSSKHCRPKLNSFMKHNVYYMFSSEEGQFPHQTCVFDASQFLPKVLHDMDVAFIKRLKEDTKHHNEKYHSNTCSLVRIRPCTDWKTIDFMTYKSRKANDAAIFEKLYRTLL